MLARPDAPRGAVLGDLLEEVDVAVEEEAETRREVVDVEPGGDGRLDVGEAVGEREGQLLGGGAARLADVVPAHRDGMPARHVGSAEGDHVGDQPHRRLHRVDELLLGDVLLEDVVLEGAPEAVDRHTLLLGDHQVLREDDRGRGVDGHRGGDATQVDAVEEGAHVLDGVDGDPAAADLTERLRRVTVVAHQRGHVEGHRQPGLAVVEEEAVALVGVGGAPEPGELAHRPQLSAVHRLVDAARVRVLTGGTEVAVDVDPGDARRARSSRSSGRPPSVSSGTAGASRRGWTVCAISGLRCAR